MDDTLRNMTPLCRVIINHRRYVVENRFRFLPFIAALIFALACPVSSAHAVGVEAKVKSAYLYNLLRRTVWPDSTFKNDETPYRVGILGTDNLEGLLEKIAQRKKVNKRSIHLVRFKTMKEYQPCHMLYVPGYLAPEQQQEILKLTSGTPCLVVGDSPGFAQAGASANFIDREDGTIGLQLNLAQARKHQLKFDQQLVEVAEPVGEE